MIALKRILVATDFSEPSGAALGYGRELARCFDAQLVVLHVVEDTRTGAIAANGFTLADRDLQRTVEEAGHRQVQALVGGDRMRLRAEAVIITSNSPAAAIVEYATRAEADLIVIGTHGRGVMAHLLMGSVAERVVRTAPCPVLTVRHPEREFVLPDALVAVTVAKR
jgi:nucleotide-binding universal stress UspA family protein